MKKLLAATSVAALLPFAAAAATAQELQVQIQALLQQVQALQQQQGATTAATAAPPAASGGQCPLISRTLRRGASGSDVTRLQQFLARDPSVYPEGQVTGFFGALTETAVKKFQCKNQIVCDGSPDSTGYGVVGPRTAAILALQCPAGSGGGGGGGGANVGGFISVNPVQGTAPLNVSVQVTVNTTRSCTGGSYILSYGDSSAPVTINVPIGNCAEMRQTLAHTYATGGSYIVTLRAGGHQTSATVNVLGSVDAGDAMSATPRSGEAPLNVSFAGKANASGSCSPEAYTLQFGDGTSANIPVSNCSVSTFAVTHGYTSEGTFIARLKRGSSEVTSTTIRVQTGPGAQGGGEFSVSAGYGGDAFSVLATFQIASACTAYDIDWGDGTARTTQSAGSCSAGQTTKEVSHTYSGNGTYTITLKRGSGSSQSTDTAGVSIVY